MTATRPLQERNREFAARFGLGELGVVPRLSLIVLTCVDPRVDPTHFWRLEPGEAKMLRNAGGRVTEAVIQDLAFVTALLKQVAGETVPLELAIVQHTECGAARLADTDFREAIAKASGLDPAVLARRGITDHREAILTDIDLLRKSPLNLPGLRASGHLYDVKSGRVTELIAATEL
ncbi:MAG: carbonic anhydrase [Candidatus Zixiibacteriota bacterium]